MSLQPEMGQGAHASKKRGGVGGPSSLCPRAPGTVPAVARELICTSGCADATVKVKISFEAEMRRFSCAASFGALAGAVRKYFGLASIEGFAFQYIDRDQDTITVGSSEELLEAIREMVSGADDTLRLGIVPARTSAAPEPSHMFDCVRAMRGRARQRTGAVVEANPMVARRRSRPLSPVTGAMEEEEDDRVASGSGGELDGGGGRDGSGGGDGQDDDNTVALAMFHRAWELAI